MPLILIKEDGTGLSNANAYANVADADAYHDEHLYATTWTSAVTATKEKALVRATSLIDINYLFAGHRLKSSQALQWPRYNVRDLDGSGGQEFLPDNEIPKLLIKATCEVARRVIESDRESEPPDGEGLSALAVHSLKLTFDKRDRRPMITQTAQLYLAKLGSLIERASGKLIRA